MSSRTTGTLAVLLLTLACAGPISVYANDFSVGDRITTVDESPVMTGNTTHAVLPAGSRLIATDVRDNWVAVTIERGGRSITGWISREHLIADPGNLEVIFSDQDALAHEQAAQYALPTGKSVVISVTSQRPVDVFVVSAEGLDNFKWIAKNGRGQMKSFQRRLNVRSTQIEWTPPNNQKFHLLVDNTTFPDAGADPLGQTQITVRFLRPDVPLEEPVAGLGLVLGRVSLDYDGYEGRRGPCTEPLTVHLAHKTADEDDDDAQIIRIPADADGWFAIGNLVPERKYWVAAVEGLTFTVKPSFRISSPIRSKDADDETPLVHDVGFFQFHVNTKGRVSTSVTGPDFRVGSRKSGEGNSVQFGDTGPLARHKWFVKEHSASGWVSQVLADRQRLEEKRMQKELQAAPAPPADPSKPKSIPAPPTEDDSQPDAAPAPAPPVASAKDERSIALN